MEIKILKTTCCEAIVEPERDHEEIAYDKQYGFDHKNDYGIYHCPKCNKDTAVTTEYI